LALLANRERRSLLYFSRHGAPKTAYVKLVHELVECRAQVEQAFTDDERHVCGKWRHVLAEMKPNLEPAARRTIEIAETTAEVDGRLREREDTKTRAPRRTLSVPPFLRARTAEG
jgi:hypothetical protein